MSLWDRQEGESNLWYDRFERFRLMGPHRSLLALYNDEMRDRAKEKDQPFKRKQAVSRPWHDKMVEFRWRERAEAWDEHLRQQQRLEDERLRAEEQEKVRDLRRTTIRALQGMLGRVLTAEQEGNYNVDAKTLKDLSTAAANIFKESRLEFGEPTEITDNKIDLETHVSQFTDLFQKMGQHERGRSE